MKFHLYILYGAALIFTLSGNLFSQNETKKWYFGVNAALDFMTSPPTILTNNQMNVAEGCASIANSAGSLLFYTDGSTIWNQTHAIMANGTGLLGNGTSCQSSLIVKKPGSQTQYYVFTVQGQAAGGSAGLNYSIIDITLAAGLGSVTVKNFPLYSAMCAERITGIRNCNGTDYWIVVHDFNNITNNYLAYNLTATGVNTTAVISSVGVNQFLQPVNVYGCMKISPNGKKIASALYTGLELCDFDISTGVVSNPIFLLNYNSGQVYGCEFSPDGTKLYGGLVSLNGPISQWNLCAGSSTAIAASHFTIAANGGMSMQLAPNGKIYVAHFNTLATVGVINNPNIAGIGCNYNPAGQSVSPKACFKGLPNFAGSFFLPPASSSPFTYTLNNLLGCQTASFTAPAAAQFFTVVGCANSGYSLTGLQWNFGDPVSGANNTSTITNPSHAFTSLGTYTTQLILFYSCGGGTDTIRQVVNVNQPCISVASTSITCASLGSATVNVLSGVGPYSCTWAPGGQNGLVATGLAPGSYTVTFFDAGNNITTTLATLFTPLVPLTGTLQKADSVRCNGANTATAIINNFAGGSGNQYYLWSNGISTFSTQSVSTLGAGTWSIVVTDALTACKINSVFVVSQPPPLVLSISSNSPNACQGNSIALSATISGGTPGYLYSWVGGSTSNTRIVSEPIGGSYIYTLNGTDSYSCPGSNTISINFVAPPTLSVINAFICPLGVGTISVFGANSYTWSDNSVGSFLVDSPTVTTQYSVIGSVLGCTSSAQAFIILKGVPVPLFSSNSPICENKSLILGVSAASSYSWSGPNGFSSAIRNPTIINAPLLNAGVYVVTVTAANSCTAAVSGTVTIKPLPVLALSAPSSSICLNTTSTSLNAVGTATLYNWFPNVGLSNTVGASALAFPNVTTTYSVVGSLNSCTATTTATVSVVAVPNLSLLLSHYSLCAQAFNGSPNTITMTSMGASSYTLLTPNYLGLVNANGTLNPVNPLPPYTLGLATATLLGSNGVCTVSTTKVFSVIPNPTIGINSYTPIICAGDSYTYTANGADSYTWSAATPGSTLYTTGNFAVANASINSLFSVFGSSLGCFSPIRTSTLTVVTLPTVAIVPAKPQICLGDKITLSANGNGASYFWSPMAGLNSQNGVNVIANPKNTQNYTVVCTANNCSNSAVVTVSVLALPVPLILPVSTITVCLNDAVNLQGGGGIVYNWDGPGNFKYSGQTATFIAANLDLAGYYTLTVTDGNGCSAKTNTILVINDLPTGNLVFEKQKGCVPFCTEFYFDKNAEITGAWYSGKSTSTLAITKINANGQPVYKSCFDTPGNPFLRGKLKDKQTGCENVLDYFVTAYEKPSADFTWLPEHPVEGIDEVIFTNNTTGADQNKWKWFFMEPDKNQDVPYSENENTSFRFDQSGLFPIAYVVRNKWNCADTVIKSIVIESDFHVYVPNVFTPNGDDLNDIFLPVVRGTKKYNLQIFNRWGQELFQTFEPSKGWDGIFIGEACKQDVYVWKISVSGINGEAREISGTVLLQK